MSSQDGQPLLPRVTTSWKSTIFPCRGLKWLIWVAVMVMAVWHLSWQYGRIIKSGQMDFELSRRPLPMSLHEPDLNKRENIENLENSTPLIESVQNKSENVGNLQNSTPLLKSVPNRTENIEENLENSTPSLVSVPNKTRNVEGNMKKILYWTTFFGVKDFNNGVGSAAFAKCEVSSCTAHFDRNVIPKGEADAVILHGRDMGGVQKELRTNRSSSARYVFVLLESPVNDNNFKYNNFNNFFNYTMTYHKDADMVLPYGKFIQREHPVEINKNFAEKKTKLATWFVSNCGTSSMREKLVDSLQKHIQVDIYGQCGDKCPDNDCMALLKNDYKFYFSFENSLCEDYVTEKFFKIFNTSAIPVVYGAAEYSKIAPEHSFIDVLDFESPKKIADYLLYLDRNDTAFNEYFSWKRNYTTESNLNFKTAMCSLCAKLHSDEPPKSIPDLDQLYQQGKCSPPTEGRFAPLMKQVL